MQQRLGRRSAGEQVLARAARLSDDLLELETSCFAAITGEFEDASGRALWRVSEAWRKHDDPVKFAADDVLKADLSILHSQVILSTMGYVAGMASLVRDTALESIGDELETCEKTLSKKYVGTAVEAVEAARDRSEQMVSDRLDDHLKYAEQGQFAFDRLVKEQFALVRLYKEDRERMLARMFGVENRLPGNGGRGVWWRADSGLHASARDVSIRLASVIRIAAMQEFNTAAARR